MEQLMTLKQAAHVVGVTYHQAASLAREGILPVVKVGRQYRVDPETLREWIKSGGRAYEGGWKKKVAN